MTSSTNSSARVFPVVVLDLGAVELFCVKESCLWGVFLSKGLGVIGGVICRTVDSEILRME